MRTVMKKRTVMFVLAILFIFSILPKTEAKAAAVDALTAQDLEDEDLTGEGEEQAEFSEEDLEDATRESMIEGILSQNPEDAGDAIRVKPEVPRTTYTKDVSFSRTVMKGIFSSTELFFYVPEYWETEYVYAEIQYEVSQLIQSKASSMTFSVNNVTISSCRVAFEEGNKQIAYVQIPIELVKEGYNSFTISTYARLYDEEGCIDDFTNANWLSVDETSYIRCGYELKKQTDKISYYPYPFMSTVEETGKGLYIVVSDSATDGEVAAAMNLMADLGTETGKENNIQFSLMSDFSISSATRTIVVSEYNNLPAGYKQMVTDTAGLEEKAVLVLGRDDRNNPLLLITSANPDCLLEAVYMLMDEDRVSQEKNRMATVKLGSADIAVNSTALSQMVAGNYTIKDIIGSGLTYVGPFHQEQLIYLPFSEDYFLSDAGKVTLNFRYSENLDFNRSLISVYWGNVPVASKKLEKEKATGDELTFAMPADVVGTTTGAIRITFDLEIKDMICSPRQEQVPWSYVSDQSVLFLPASTGIVLTFDLKPSPFRTDGKFNDMMLVISDNPTTEELNLYGQIIGMYGEGVDPYGTFYVKRASEFTESDADYNIITAGTLAGNGMMKILNKDLYFAFDESTGSFLSNEQLILSDTYANDIAVMQLLESPFANNRGVLAVTAANDKNLKTVEDFMRVYSTRYSLTKDCVVIDNDFDIKAYRFINNVIENEEPTLLGRLAQNKQSLIFTVVATSVMLMMLIGVIIILIRIRMYHRKKED